MTHSVTQLLSKVTKLHTFHLQTLLTSVCVCLFFISPAGSAYYDNVRPLAYPDADAVLICFDVSRPETLNSVTKKVSKRRKPFWTAPGEKKRAKIGNIGNVLLSC